MISLTKWALGALAFVAMSLGLASPAQAYHHNGVSLSFGHYDSGATLFVPIGHHRYHHRRHYGHYPYYHHRGYGYHPYAYYPPRYRYQYRHHWRHRPHYYRNHYGWRDHGYRHHRKHWRHHRWH